MYKSIKETQKLFKIEGLEGDQINIRTSQYLLSLPEEKQKKVLSDQMERLKKDLAEHEAGSSQGSTPKGDEVDKAQLQLLIQVIQNLLSQI